MFQKDLQLQVLFLLCMFFAEYLHWHKKTVFSVPVGAIIDRPHVFKSKFNIHFNIAHTISK